MSVTEQQQTIVLRCPGCSGGMERWETICAACRSELESVVLSVRAEDYPIPARAAPKAEPIAHQQADVDADASVSKGEDSTYAVDDLDLVPLAPLDEPKRPAARPTARSTTVVRPPAAVPVVHDSASAFTPPSRWKHVLIAIGALLLAGVIAAIVWSLVIPPAVVDGLSDPAMKGATAQPQHAPTTRNSR